jgi:hypothetical protein
VRHTALSGYDAGVLALRREAACVGPKSDSGVMIRESVRNRLYILKHTLHTISLNCARTHSTPPRKNDSLFYS